LPRELGRLRGAQAFHVFEKARSAIAHAILASKVFEPSDDNIEAIKYDDNSILWKFYFDNEEKAKAFMNWMKNTLQTLRNMLGFDRIETKDVKGHEVVIAYSKELGGKEEFPTAFWVKGNVLYWFESGMDPDALDEILWSTLSDKEG